MDGATRPLLEQLEASLAGADDEAAFAPLAFFAARELELDPAEVHAACRRAILLLASGGDPYRELDPDGRAVRAVAADLDAPRRRAQLTAALSGVRAEAEGLPQVAGALDALSADTDAAWRWLAVALLAEELAGNG